MIRHMYKIDKNKLHQLNWIYSSLDRLPTEVGWTSTSVTSKKLQNAPENFLLEKWKIWTPVQKLHKNVVDLGKLIGAKGFKKLQ